MSGDVTKIPAAATAKLSQRRACRSRSRARSGTAWTSARLVRRVSKPTDVAITDPLGNPCARAVAAATGANLEERQRLESSRSSYRDAALSRSVGACGAVATLRGIGQIAAVAGGGTSSKEDRVPQWGRRFTPRSQPLARASLRPIASPRPELEK